LRPHVWRKRGIGKELHSVSNADAVTQPKAIVVKLERRCHDRRGSFLPRRPARCTDFHHLRATDTACAERFATTPAILDLRCMRDNAPHIAEG
jgi:hypothetical protein